MVAKIQVHQYTPEIYPRKLFVVKGTRDPNCLKGIFSYYDGEELIHTDVQTANMSTYKKVILNETQMYGVLVVLWPDCKHTPGQLAHEAVHVANAIFDELGINFVYSSDEHYAYFIQWITNCLYEVETRKFKK